MSSSRQKLKKNPVDYPDYQAPARVAAVDIDHIDVDIETQTLAQMRTDIVAQTLAKLNVDIIAQTLEELKTDIVAQTLAALKVDIVAQTLPKMNMDIVAQTLAELDIDIYTQTISELRMRPRYGAAQCLTAWASVPAYTEKTIRLVTGSGIFLFCFWFTTVEAESELTAVGIKADDVIMFPYYTHKMWNTYGAPRSGSFIHQWAYTPGGMCVTCFQPPTGISFENYLDVILDNDSSIDRSIWCRVFLGTL